MSFYTRQKSALLPTSLLEPTPKSSGNAAEGYVSWQNRERMNWFGPRTRVNATLAADGETEVASNGVGFGTH
jgi:hypothetical protein